MNDTSLLMCSRSLFRRTSRIFAAGYVTPRASIRAAIVRLSAVTPVIMRVVIRAVSRLVSTPPRDGAAERGHLGGRTLAPTLTTSGYLVRWRLRSRTLRPSTLRAFHRGRSPSNGTMDQAAGRAAQAASTSRSAATTRMAAVRAGRPSRLSSAARVAAVRYRVGTDPSSVSAARPRPSPRQKRRMAAQATSSATVGKGTTGT